MTQEKAANVVDLGATRAALAKDSTVGIFLADARRGRGLTLSDISVATKIKIDQLHAIEESDADRLPATPYAVGFVKVYAGYLGLDSDALAAQFKKEIGANRPDDQEIAAKSTMATDDGPAIPIGPLLGIAGILIFVVWVAFQVIGTSGTRDADRTATETQGGVRLGTVSAPAPQPRVRTAAPADAAATDSESQPSAIVEEQATPEAGAPVSDEVIENSAAIDPAAAAEAPPPVEETPPVVETEIVDEPTPVAQPEILRTDDLNARQTEELAASASSEDAIAGQATESNSAALFEIPNPGNSEQTSVVPVTAPDAQPELVVVAARLTRSPSPRYPSRCARNANSRESVTVMFDVTASGRTANARVIDSTNSCFDTEAVNAINRWRFQPRTIGGSARPETGRQATLRFE
ncbi:MAG: TonB family protein [Marinicaulis sp.]|nr:TonB family protein [Marinicaulis sp.]